MEDLPQHKPSQFSDPAYSQEVLSISDKASVHTFSDFQEEECHPPHYALQDSISNYINPHPSKEPSSLSPLKEFPQLPIPIAKSTRQKSETLRSRPPSQALSEIDSLFSAGDQPEPSAAVISEDKEHLEYLRFLHDLEFLTLLANPEYLHFLAKQNYFSEPEFLNYLEYLVGFFKKQNYIKFLKYPVCMDYARLILGSKAFRENLKEQHFVDLILFQAHCSAQDKYGAPQQQKVDQKTEMEQKIAQIESELKKKEESQRK